MEYQEKKNQLRNRMEELCKDNICMAFSGGVDSSLLLKLAGDCCKEAGTKVYAVTFDTQLHPTGDLKIAREIAQQVGAIHKVFSIDELENPEILENPVNRCYLCKKMLFVQLFDFAASKGIHVVIEGSNQDDMGVYRPGFQAVKELGGISPLVECGFTKDEVRKYAAELGLSVSSRPSTPCMATRLPYGTRIEREVLKKIEEGETYLREHGFYNVRLRVHKDVARLELDLDAFPQVMKMREELVTKIKALGFDYVTLDLSGFKSGSMDKN